MRVLLDTNVLSACIASAARPTSTPPTQIWHRWHEKQFTLLTSEHVLAELDRVFEDPWFIERIPLQTLARQKLNVRRNAETVRVIVDVRGVARHPEDDLVLSAAVSGNADYLVTGDADFRRVGEYQGVKLRTPSEFLRELSDHTD